jgi:ABC-type multidrug transport system ATPase subunit
VTAIATNALTKSFADHVAVEDVTFDVRSGEVYGLIGPNGAGKTTLIRMLCGLYRPSSGSGSVLGLDIERDRALIRARVGYMSQGNGLYGDLTVGENLRFYGDVYGVRDGARAREVARWLGVDDVLGQVVATLSTGLRQRAALAAVLVHRPDLVVLDEPTSGVDPVARDTMWALVREIAAQGVTALVTTHVMPEAERCDRLALLADSRLIAAGTPHELVERSGLTVARIEAAPWSEAFARLRAHFPDAALYGTRVHIPVAGSGVGEREIRDVLAGLEVRSLTWRAPSIEDAFIALVGSTAARS